MIHGPATSSINKRCSQHSSASLLTFRSDGKLRSWANVWQASWHDQVDTTNPRHDSRCLTWASEARASPCFGHIAIFFCWRPLHWSQPLAGWMQDDMKRLNCHLWCCAKHLVCSQVIHIPKFIQILHCQKHILVTQKSKESLPKRPQNTVSTFWFVTPIIQKHIPKFLHDLFPTFQRNVRTSSRTSLPRPGQVFPKKKGHSTRPIHQPCSMDLQDQCKPTSLPRHMEGPTSGSLLGFKAGVFATHFGSQRWCFWRCFFLAQIFGCTMFQEKTTKKHLAKFSESCRPNLRPVSRDDRVMFHIQMGERVTTEELARLGNCDTHLKEIGRVHWKKHVTSEILRMWDLIAVL